MKQCFFIASLGAPNSEIRERTDSLWEFVIHPVCEELQYKVIRSDLITGIGSITQDIIRMLIESDLVLADITNGNPKNEIEYTRDIFIVHGHDGELKNELARFLQRLEFNPIILHEPADRGQIILQKLQYEGKKVGYAFILHTPDDEGRRRNGKADLLPRSRQNVVFEHGMFIGQFTHSRVCAIVKEGVEIPSDLSGVIYKRIPSDGNLDSIAFQLVQELRAAGYVIDANKLLS